MGVHVLHGQLEVFAYGCYLAIAYESHISYASRGLILAGELQFYSLLLTEREYSMVNENADHTLLTESNRKSLVNLWS